MTEIREQSTSLRSLWGNCILKLDEPESVSPGGINIPAPAREEALTGIVMHAGPGRVDAQGIMHPSELQPGDRVSLSRHLGYTVKHDGQSYYLIAEKFVDAVTNKAHEIVDECPRVPGADYEYLWVSTLAGAEYVKLLQGAGWRQAEVIKTVRSGTWLRRDRTVYAKDAVHIETDLDELSPIYGVDYQYLAVDLNIFESGDNEKYIELQRQGWEPRAFTHSSPPRLIWMRRDKKKVPLHNPVTSVRIEPAIEEVKPHEVPETEKPQIHAFQKSLMDWEEGAFNGEELVKQSSPLEPESLVKVVSEGEPKPAGSCEYDYLNHHIRINKLEGDNSAESQQLKLWCREGWEPDPDTRVETSEYVEIYRLRRFRPRSF